MFVQTNQKTRRRVASSASSAFSLHVFVVNAMACKSKCNYCSMSGLQKQCMDLAAIVEIDVGDLLRKKSPKMKTEKHYQNVLSLRTALKEMSEAQLMFITDFCYRIFL